MKLSPNSHREFKTKVEGYSKGSNYYMYNLVIYYNANDQKPLPDTVNDFVFNKEVLHLIWKKLLTEVIFTQTT